MKKRLIILASLFALWSASNGVLAQPTVLYHQNNKAERISGSIAQLKQAIRDGKPIRIYMNLGFVEHAMDTGFLSIIGDNVYAQISGIEAQIPNRKDSTISLRPYTRHIGLYSTLSPYEIKWYVVE